jgi:hypothetical protein
MKNLFSQGIADGESAATRFADLKEVDGGRVMACLLNLATIAESTFLPEKNLVDYLVELEWPSMERDRVFAWARPELIGQLEIAEGQGGYAVVPHVAHDGATRSYKENLFNEANLQITLHENDRKQLGADNCVRIELDVDYFRDSLSHLLLEVLPNSFGNVTDPRGVYCLRWVAGRRANVPEFDPPYVIQKG